MARSREHDLFGERKMIFFRFYEELNDYLSPDRRKVPIAFPGQGPVTVRAAIADFGVPPEEVDLVLVNGQSVPFDHMLWEGDRVSVYPIFETLDISGLTRLRDRPLIQMRRSEPPPSTPPRKSCGVSLKNRPF